MGRGRPTEDFLSCLSKAEIEAVASAHGILPKLTGKATRAAVIAHFKDADYVYHGAKFALTADQIEAHAGSGNARSYGFDDGGADDGEQLDGAEPPGLEDAAPEDLEDAA